MNAAITDSLNLDLHSQNDNDHPQFRDGDQFWHIITAEGDELARLETVFGYTQQALADDVIRCIDFEGRPIPNIARVRLVGSSTPAERLAACRADYAAAFGKGP